MRELKGKVAAVTGAASGLGRAMALAFADEGMQVALGDVTDTSEVFAEVERKGVAALSMKLDVSRAEEVEAFAQLTKILQSLPGELGDGLGILQAPEIFRLILFAVQGQDKLHALHLGYLCQDGGHIDRGIGRGQDSAVVQEQGLQRRGFVDSLGGVEQQSLIGSKDGAAPRRVRWQSLKAAGLP